MNYYEHHLGDYAKGTTHLSMMEHGAYRMLLDRYYSTEKPIPKDQIYRIARATTASEKRAVDSVLFEFFVLDDGAFFNARANAEIQKVSLRRNASIENGRHGGRPKTVNNQDYNKPDGLILGSENKSQINLHQSPITSNQTEEQQHTPKGVEFVGVSDQVINDFKALRSRLRAPITKTVIAGIQREADKSGISLEDALIICCERGWRGFKAEWVMNQPARASPVKSFNDASKLAAARTIFGTEIEGNGNATGRIIDITTTTSGSMGSENLSGNAGQLRIAVPESMEDRSASRGR